MIDKESIQKQKERKEFSEINTWKERVWNWRVEMEAIRE